MTYPEVNSNFLLNSEIHELRELEAFSPTEEEGRAQSAASQLQSIVLSIRNTFCVKHFFLNSEIYEIRQLGDNFPPQGRSSCIPVPNYCSEYPKHFVRKIFQKLKD